MQSMRRLLVLLFIGTSAVTATASQVASRPVREIMLSQKRPGGVNVILEVQQTEFYLEGPTARVPADAIDPAVTPHAKGFGVRAWNQGDTARVIVYAVVPDGRAPKGETETPIATFAVSANAAAVEVSETEQWGAARIVIRPVFPLRRR